jgi:hypothetical protein
MMVAPAASIKRVFQTKQNTLAYGNVLALALQGRFFSIRMGRRRLLRPICIPVGLGVRRRPLFFNDPLKGQDPSVARIPANVAINPHSVIPKTKKSKISGRPRAAGRLLQNPAQAASLPLGFV